jgi:hypothetical protein
MRIGYVTTDEVNRVLATRMAARLGASVSTVEAGDVHAMAGCDVMLFDLDVVPRDERPAVLDEVLASARKRPTAVHGYCITDEQANRLHQHRVPVGRRLLLDLIRTLERGWVSQVRSRAGQRRRFDRWRALCEPAVRRRQSVPGEDSFEELTWVNLAN